MKRLLVLGIALFLLAPAAYAGNFYVGASLLDAGIDVDSFDEDDSGYKIWGGYNFLKFFGVEAAYNDFGEPDSGGISVEPTAWSASAKGTLPLGFINLFAKAGFYSWDVDGTFDDDGTDVGYGIGAAIVVLKQLEIRAEYELIELDDADLDVISVGAGWRF
jgi:OOP family OmpA-OmpF porin